MTLTYKTFTVETKAVDEEQGIYEAMVSTESVDRDADILLAEGADITNYLKNPVVLFGHNYYSPEAVVATALEVNKMPGIGIRLVFQFVKRGISKTADLVHDLWREKYLRAMSVGFIPKEWERRKDDNDEELARGFLFKLWEFLEGSIVVIPSNQDALALAYTDMQAKGYSRVDLDEVFQAKRGRVLSAANEKRIRQAVAALQEVLDSLGDESDEDEDDDGKESPDTTCASCGLPIKTEIGQYIWCDSYSYYHGDCYAEKTTIPYRDQGTADEDEAWKAPTLADFTDGTFDDLSNAEKRRIAAHYTWSANMPPEAFGDLKLPHHRAAKSGVGPAIWRGVAAAMAVLMGARGGAAIPEGDMAACHAHLSKHYAEFDKEPPELRAYSAEELKTLFPIVEDEPEDEEDAEPNIDDTPDPGDTHDASEAELNALAGPLSELVETLKIRLS